MATEIYCFDHESRQFQSISSIEPATRWATTLIGEIVNVVQINCLPDNERTEIKIIASDITPEEAITPSVNLLDGLDLDSAWLERTVEEHNDTSLKLSDPQYPGRGTTIFVRHRELQNWQYN